ncbi:FkbM family methyltransferase [Lacinutrix iliipiscaria]|uniref:FkbM family methyltransferase n=1 Tax=Lacinutrix iliipiscaria TaxID=1230532 RepID=A0ABW5WM55_9FLAO
MNFKKIINYFSFFIKKESFKLVDMELCGVPLKVVKRSLRQKIDQDDTWWFYLSKHHDIIFDIGCNVGYTATLALIQDPNRQIILVDPNPKALQKAAINLIENGLGSKAQYIAAFVGNTIDETIKLYTIGSKAAGSMHASHAKTAAAKNLFIEVKTVTLDYLYTFYNIKPDLVKIDVEGAETIVMESAKKLAQETKCSFFIEMHKVENLGMEKAGQFMIDWSSEMNYSVWYPKTGELLTNAEPIKNRGKCHLLLLPKEKSYPEYLKGIKQNAPLPKSI